ncbi:class I SAM-dependent methyltransferase [Vreelandella populi]|uniref:Class I SAM-dependent methyltransferase n=1 Tax=Vreelandella populi TaxID=2498858 RepID=A0A433LH24_9GAMM|nr:class I SAM-dependent methyltransferase [Halomonas populi]RUR40835.1 class I SAM-dependent methyltransferase [Halomonas populi]RUR49342.1 class I SAM-dependent methyltransferase [Halomonas populi]
MTQYFTESGMGERYDQYRPKTHQAVVQKIQQHLQGRHFERVVDVACGTGDSTVPLLAIGQKVIGIDSSDEMLAIAQKRGLSVRKADYTDLPQQGRFDLISTCMAFHWFDDTRAIASYKAASNPGAVWLIYNFAFAGHTTSEQFNNWLRNEYFKRYPSPPRNRFDDMTLADDEGLSVIASESGWLPIEFTLEPLIGYLSTQSNIEEAARKGRTLNAITAELRKELSGIDITGAFKYAYSYEILEYTGSQYSWP